MPTPCRGPWWIDETYVKVSSRWRYIYRAIDQFGQIIDTYVSPRRDAGAARGFFTRALSTTKAIPIEVTTDKAAVYPRVVDELEDQIQQSYRHDRRPCPTTTRQRCHRSTPWMSSSAPTAARVAPLACLAPKPSPDSRRASPGWATAAGTLVLQRHIVILVSVCLRWARSSRV
jgi:transposase-like protein